MTHSRLAFGEMVTYGELARGTDELSIDMALALGEPPAGAVHLPPFATVPVLLDGAQIGVLTKVVFVHGGTVYEFRSGSGNTRFSATTTEAALHYLQNLLGFAQSTNG